MKWMSPLLFILFASCAAKKQAPTNSTLEKLELRIYQGDSSYKIDQAEHTIALRRDEFTLEFNINTYNSKKPPYYASIAFVADEKHLIHFKDSDYSGYDNPFFSGGTGMAGYRDKPYSTVYARHNGHHHVFYENKSDRRLDKVEWILEDRLKAEWTVNEININGQGEQKMKETTVNKLYIMFLTDLNQNEKMDKGETHLITLEFVD